MVAPNRRAALGVILAAPLTPALTVAASERADYRVRLLTAYAEDRASRPISAHAESYSVESEAAMLVQKRCWAVAREVIALPPPTTAESLALTALAASILLEADFTTNDPTVVAAVGLTRAVLAFASMPLLPGFVGFGDEPDHGERDDALHERPGGTLPGWAIAEAEAKLCA